MHPASCEPASPDSALYVQLLDRIGGHVHRFQQRKQFVSFRRGHRRIDRVEIRGEVDSRCEAVHAARVNRCITTKYQGAITLAGVRGVAVADVIRKLGASSQLDDEVSALFLPAPAHVLV